MLMIAHYSKILLFLYLNLGGNGGEMNRASKRTRDNLVGVDSRLILLVGYALAISEIDFFVNEGLRSEARQKKLYGQGKSRCDGIIKKSKHQEGKAIDIYYVGWKNTDDEDDKRWDKLIESFRKAGKMLGLKLDFGYDWGWDKPHIELK